MRKAFFSLGSIRVNCGLRLKPKTNLYLTIYMTFIPKTFKYKKFRKGRISESKNKRTQTIFGQIALKATEAGRLTYRQLESARKCIKKYIKPLGGIVKRKVCLTVTVTTKPIASRMGRGKGRVAYHVCPLRKGQIIFEIYYTNVKETSMLLMKATHKLPIRTKILAKQC